MSAESAIGQLGGVGGVTAIDISSTDHMLAVPCRGLYVGTAGDVKVGFIDGSFYTFKNLAAGIEHVIQAKQIYKTGTTAADIGALK